MAKPWVHILGLNLLSQGLKLVLACKWVLERLLRVLGPVFVILGFGLISYAVYVHFVFVLPWYSESPVLSFNLFSVIHLSLDIWLCLGIAWNYSKSVITKPLAFKIELPPEELAMLKSNGAEQSSRKNTRYCKYCEAGKTDRMHHCHVCNTCIPGMDHHCPWIGNCVGFHNHHYFVLFLIYLFYGCVYAASMSFAPFVVALNPAAAWPYDTDRSSVVFSFILATAVAGSLAFLGGWQLVLVFTGQTSIEYYVHKENARFAKTIGRSYRNPNDLGYQRNFQRFFGVDSHSWWFSWLVPGMSNPVYLPPRLHPRMEVDENVA